MLDFDWRTTNNCHQIQLCSSVIKSGYEFFDTYGNNGDITALITLATGPFIVAAGGISNIFLHRPARISRLEDEQELNLVQIKESKWLVKVPSRINQQSPAEQNGRLSDDEDVLSAPPFCGSTPEIRPTNEQISTSTSRNTSNKAEESSTLKYVTRGKFEKHGDASSEQCVRPATGSEGAASSNPQPPRLPTFPASALGPWQAVIAYDACARLCLPAWTMQCY
ncbi:hypothetical protein KIW84_041147 [Lathyrus oleraceus]|uniref:Uncharacterized protein n=1 Tax=Pisum sativum TaxID=3888 RepID=A0A9D4X7C0_PEA|nr:hypothetical protein KIW84_041147 [Pisum sativum]